MHEENGTLFVITAPSGTGKSTLARRLLAADDALHFSVSFTTRKPRPGETDGKDYRFLDPEAFQRRIDDGGFLEWAEVYGKRYGTGLKETRLALESGADLLLDIDVQGARQVRRSADLPSVSVMILPPDRESLEARLRGRGTETQEDLDRRLAAAAEELADYPYFDYLVLNDDLDRALETLQGIVAAERARQGRRAGQAGAILESFRRSR